MRPSDNPLAPHPKVWIPAALALVAILFSWIVSGDFAEAELAALLVTVGYFVVAYALPSDGFGSQGGGAGPRHRERRERRAPLDYEEEEPYESRSGPADYETRQFPPR